MSEEIAQAAADLAYVAQLRADLGWWHATVANYVTSATTEDRALLRDTMAEALTCPHAGTVFLAELKLLRELYDDVQRWRESGGDVRDLRYILETADRVTAQRPAQPARSQEP